MKYENKIISGLCIGLLTFALLSTMLISMPTAKAAPIKPFNRYGAVIFDGAPADPNLPITCWVDGVLYGFNLTNPSPLATDIYCNGTDSDTPNIPAKLGGENNDLIIYKLHVGNKVYIANQVDTYMEAGVVAANTEFSSANQLPTLGIDLIIEEIHYSNGTGPDYIRLYNKGTATATLDNNWKLKHNGKDVVGAYEKWTLPLTGSVPASGLYTTPDIPNTEFSYQYGDLELCWKDPNGVIAAGKWVVVDRVEWAATISSHDGVPTNTTLPDYIGTSDLTYLKRKNHRDTDNCAADFETLAEVGVVPIDRVEITPAGPHTMGYGETKTFTATAYNTNNEVIPTATFQWSLNPATLGTLNTNTGNQVVFTAGRTDVSGTIKVDATFAGLTKTDSEQITVSGGTGTVQGSVKEKLTGNPIEGATVEIVGTTLAATTDANGGYTITNVPTGTQNIKASKTGYTALTKTATVVRDQTVTVDFELYPEVKSIEILPKGTVDTPVKMAVNEVASFTGVAKDVNDNVIPGVVFDWSVDIGTIEPKGATVNYTAPSTGGWANVTAAYGTLTATSTVKIVTTITLDRVTISPPGPLSMDVNSEKWFTAQAYDIENDPIATATYSWTVTGGIGALSTQSGQVVKFTATTPGTGTVGVIATYGTAEKTNSVSITVKQPVTLTKVTILPYPSVTLPINASQSFEAHAYDQNNNELTAGVTWSWTVSPTELGDLSGTTTSTTTFTAKTTGTGSVTVRATYGGVTLSNSTRVTVTTELKKLTIEAPSSVFEGEEFTVIVKDADGKVVEGAKVTFAGQSKTTGGDGKVTFTAPEVDKDKSYTIKASKEGYETASKEITVKNKAPGFELLAVIIALCIVYIGIRIHRKKRH